MALHAKTIETRPRQTHVRGPLAIVATLNRRCELKFLEGEVRRVFAGEDITDFNALPFGKVVAVVDLYDSQPYEQMLEKSRHWLEAESCFGIYGAGRHCWLTRTPQKLVDPVPCKGKQGFFFLPSEVEYQVRAQLSP